ncbi:MAG: ATP-dependent DNA helicase RecG, partial [Methylovulum sp.]
MNSQHLPVTALTGIGVQTANRLEKLGIRSLQDLVFHLPYRYEDRTRVYPIASLAAGMTVLICGKVEFTDILPRGRRSLVCRINDGTGAISLRFFHFTASQQQALKPDTWLTVFAEVRYGFAGLEMVHPDYTVIANPEFAVTESRLTPVYPLTEGLTQNAVRKAVKQALMRCDHDKSVLTDWIPAAILQQYDYPSLADAIRTLHAPDEAISAEALQDGSVPALRRLAFEELLAHHLSLRRVKAKAKVWQAPVLPGSKREIEHFLRALPFQLTN